MWKLVPAVLESNDRPVEVQLLNWKPLLAVAVTGMLALAAQSLPEGMVAESLADDGGSSDESFPEVIVWIYFTVKVTWVVWTMLPIVPVNVSVKVP